MFRLCMHSRDGVTCYLGLVGTRQEAIRDKQEWGRVLPETGGDRGDGVEQCQGRQGWVGVLPGTWKKWGRVLPGTSRDGVECHQEQGNIGQSASRDWQKCISPLHSSPVHQNTINLFWDDSKLTTYIDKCLQPMVEGLKDHPALGAWEVTYTPHMYNTLREKKLFRSLFSETEDKICFVKYATRLSKDAEFLN